MFESLICKDAKDAMTNAFMWAEHTVMTAEIETRAKRTWRYCLKQKENCITPD